MYKRQNCGAENGRRGRWSRRWLVCREGRRTAMLNVANNKIRKKKCTEKLHNTQTKEQETEAKIKKDAKLHVCVCADEVDSAFVCVCKSQTKSYFPLPKRCSEEPSIYALIYLIFISSPLSLSFPFACTLFSIIHSIHHLQRATSSSSSSACRSALAFLATKRSKPK